MKRLLLSLTAIVMASVGIPSVAGGAAVKLACPLISQTDTVNGSDTILVGTVKELTDDVMVMGTPRHAAVVEVERYLKGRGPAEVTIAQSGYHGDYSFTADTLGQKALFFLRDTTSPFRIGSCLRPAGLEGVFYPDDPDNEEFLDSGRESLRQTEAITGPGSPPLAPSAEAEQDGDTPWLILALAAGVAGALLTGGAAVLYARRRTRG
jgi:hypothetical protein